MSFFGKLDFNSLSETERAIHHYMSSNSDKIPFMRVRDIANESHTSSSSVMRFIRKVGYDSYTEFRTHFKSSEVEKNELFVSKNYLDDSNFPNDFETRILTIAEQVQSCENIIFFGIGSSGTMCEYAARRLAILGYNTYAMTDPTFPIFSKLRNTTENIIFVLSITGMTTEILEMVNGFKNNLDYKIVAITANADSNLALMSDYVLDYRVPFVRLKQHEDLTSQIPSLYIIEVLSDALLNLNNEDSNIDVKETLE
ncbi:MAG: MurR/RpiR family transcriptional regulator [Ruoffia tabacinasalis]|uniref:MurR/RpiR family transcriptional regulator n=1 Tax=Ruoffia tabacinasalis TaxID=87458 RepID=A0A5R9EMV8_9LACT|nr:MurR/RpiR family transcriptional regulator [Ruoffia tabacinasalis]TLQ48944.1 MurR/RpiR family transcriptional regulator [Ruoffia tabacinasalis]